MELFKIIYKAIEGLKKSIDGLLKNMDKALNKQDALLFADGSNVTSYRDLQLDILKNLSFEGTTLFMAKPDSRWEVQYGNHENSDTNGTQNRQSQEYIVKFNKYPIKEFRYVSYDEVSDDDEVLAVLSLDYAFGFSFSYLFDSYSNLRAVCNVKGTAPETSLYRTFIGCENLTYIENFEVSNITNMMYTFRGTRKLKKLPDLDTSQVDSFVGCISESGVTEIPNSWSFNNAEVLDTFAEYSNLTHAVVVAPLLASANSAFAGCEKLKTVSLHCGTPTQGRYMVARRAFANCNNLEEVDFYAEQYLSMVDYLFAWCHNLKRIQWRFRTKMSANTTFEECFNLERFECSEEIENSMYFADCPKLSYDSLKDIINHLITNEYSNEFGLILHQEAYDRLTPEDIAIATNKGWSVISAN